MRTSAMVFCYRLLAHSQGEQESWLFTLVSVRTPIFVLCNISLFPTILTYQVPGQHAFLPLSPQHIPRKICANVSLAVLLLSQSE